MGVSRNRPQPFGIDVRTDHGREMRCDSSYTLVIFPVRNEPQDLASFVPFPNELYRCRRASSASGRIQYLNNGERLCAGANLALNLSHGGHPSSRNRQLETDQAVRLVEAPVI